MGREGAPHAGGELLNLYILSESLDTYETIGVGRRGRNVSHLSQGLREVRTVEAVEDVESFKA
jgi:hypothetical protein